MSGRGAKCRRPSVPMRYTNADERIVIHRTGRTARHRIGKSAPKKKKLFKTKSLSLFLAETEGFEPSMRVLARMLP